MIKLLRIRKQTFAALVLAAVADAAGGLTAVSGDGREVFTVEVPPSSTVALSIYDDPGCGWLLVGAEALDRVGPSVYVEHLEAGGTVVRPDRGKAVLEPRQRSFEITYTALAFRSPERVRFRYRLEDYEDEWTEAGERRQAFYTRVPAGRYVFHVQARYGEGVWNRDGARLEVVVRPFGWETWWFRGGGVIGLVAAAAAGLRLRERQKRRRVRELESKVAQLMAECEGFRLTLELGRARDSAEEQTAKLAELDRLKSDLFADVSHQLRAPLTLTLGPLHDLRDGTCGELPPAAREQVELAGRNAEQLLGFVDEILDTARMEAGRLELRVRPGDLVALLADLAERFAALAERRGVHFHFEPPFEPIPVWGDPDQLPKVFANLLCNAMEYTPEGGRVEMTARATSGTVVVTVRDEGPGIAAEDQGRVFGRFFRVVHPRARRAGGTGLGLPLARQVAELHGGSLTLTSNPGEGSAFRVELRLGRDHFSPQQIVEDEPWATSSSPPVAKPSAGASGRTAEVAAATDRTTVLVVDDHVGIRIFVRRHLEPDYRVEEAADGAEGLALARNLLPDLVVSDVSMPEMDGLALCHALKEDPELDWVPVILLTKQAEVEDKLAGLGVGADDYLTKPFDARELKARVDNLIASRRRLWERFASSGGRRRPRLPLALGVRPTAGDVEWLERVHEAIEAGFEEETLSVETLAVRLAVHRSRLHERLRQLTGSSPLQLITELRLERAAALLEQKAVSVSEVAYSVGYDSVSHFSRRFKERYGKSPSIWQGTGLPTNEHG